MTTAPWDLTGHISSQLFGEPLPPKLPTEPGLYVPTIATDLASTAVYRLDRRGYWWADGKHVTADEVAQITRGRLDELARQKDADQ